MTITKFFRKIAETVVDPPNVGADPLLRIEQKELREHITAYAEGFSAEPRSRESVRITILNSMGYRVYAPRWKSK
jgi:hypothetical protein